jgi:hypothetical protein
MNLTFDSGALIAVERRKHRAVHLMVTGRVTVPAPCFVEWWRGRSDRREDIRRAIAIDWLSESTLKLAGEALAVMSRKHGARSLTIDAIAIASAASRRGDVLVTSDADDMFRLQSFFPGVRVLAV